MKRYRPFFESSALLSWSSNTWYVHFFKEKEHGKSIIRTGIIKKGSDGIVWAIKRGRGYNESQVETDYDTGDIVTRSGAIVFSPFDKPYTDNLHGLSAWKINVECSTAYLVDFETGKNLCEHGSLDKIEVIDSFSYGE